MGNKSKTDGQTNKREVRNWRARKKEKPQLSFKNKSKKTISLLCKKDLK